MQAKDVMTSTVISASPDTPVHDLVRLMLRHRISALPVVDEDGHVLGIVSEGDLLSVPEGIYGKPAWWLAGLMVGANIDYEQLYERTAKEVMTRPVISVEEDTELAKIAKTLEHKHIKRVPVLSNGRLVGIVSRANLLHGLANDIIERHEPGAGADRKIRAHVVNALRREPSLAPYLINVTVKGGAVTLWGVVDNDSARATAERVAAAVTDIASIHSHLASGPVSGLPI